MEFSYFIATGAPLSLLRKETIFMKMLASFWLSRSKCYIESEKQPGVKHEQHRQLSLFLQPKDTATVG